MRRLERVYSSYLKRAIKTAWLMLDELELQWVPIHYRWRLNERCSSSTPRGAQPSMHTTLAACNSFSPHATPSRRIQLLLAFLPSRLLAFSPRGLPTIAHGFDVPIVCVPQGSVGLTHACGLFGVACRHYGALQGRRKRECSQQFGLKQIQMWRRGINHPPPDWDAVTAESTLDRRYAHVPVPSSESLADCTERLRPFLEDELFPAMREASIVADESDAHQHASGTTERSTPREVPAFVITSSENLIRALITEIEGIQEADVPLLDVPHATPLVYQFDADLKPIRSHLAAEPLRFGCYLGDAKRIKERQSDIRDEVVHDPTKFYGGTDHHNAMGTPSSVSSRENPDSSDQSADSAGDTCFAVEESSGGRVSWVCN